MDCGEAMAYGKFVALLFCCWAVAAHAAIVRHLPEVSLIMQASGPVFSANPTSMDLGPSAVGVATPVFANAPPFAAPLQISNTGSSTLTTNFSFSSSEFGFDSATTLSNPISIQPGASVTGGIKFTPAAAGARSGQFISNDNAAGSPHTVPLTGTGITVPGNDFGIFLDPGAPSTLTLTAGQTTTFVVWVLAGPGLSVPISFTNSPQVSGGPAGALFTVNPGAFFGLSDGSNSRQKLTISVMVPAKTATLHRTIPVLWALPCVAAVLLGFRRGQSAYRLVVLCMVFTLASFLVSCGGSKSPGNVSPVTISVAQQINGQPVTHTLSVPVTVQ